MITLEEKMQLQKKIFLDERLSADLRREAFQKYSILHAQRSPELVKKMEQKAGLK